LDLSGDSTDLDLDCRHAGGLVSMSSTASLGLAKARAATFML
jgi:hypothetical protein